MTKLGDQANATVAEAASGRLDDIRIKSATGGWVNSSHAGVNRQGYTVGQFSAVCYLTAMQIKRNIAGYADLPIGLMLSAVGGAMTSTSFCPVSTRSLPPQAAAVMTHERRVFAARCSVLTGALLAVRLAVRCQNWDRRHRHRGVDEHLCSRGVPPGQRIDQPRPLRCRVAAELGALLPDGGPARPHEPDGCTLVRVRGLGKQQRSSRAAGLGTAPVGGARGCRGACARTCGGG